LKSLNSDKARRIRVRTVLAYPAVTIALAVSVAFALTPFGTSQVMAFAATAIPMETTAPTATSTSSTSSPSTTTPTPSATAAPSATSTTTPSPSPVPSGSAAAAPGDHHVVARIEGSAMQANYLPVDEPVLDALPHQRFRVRFRLHNSGTAATTTTPRLEYRSEGVGSFLVVPEQPVLGIPMHAAQEWIPSLDLLGGTMLGPLGAEIATADLRMGADGTFAVNGHRSTGANPDQPITLPSDSYTEQEFTVALTADAKYLTGYELRITDGGTPLTRTDVAVIRLGDLPVVPANPDDHQGIAVPTPLSAAGSTYPLLSASAITANTPSVSGVSAVYRPSSGINPLTASALSAATSAADIHGPFTLTSNQCAVCHRAHAAKAPSLLSKGSQSALCLTCHDGSIASANVQFQYNLARPVNNPVTRDYYSHDALTASNHTESQLDEFGGMSNRHSACADCHNSHKANALPDSTQTTAGWTASGRLAGVSGVSVLNGAADTAPAYTFLSGVNDAVIDETAVTDVRPITLEYQLCFKCHSGFTTLTSNATLVSGPPAALIPQYSKYALDKGIEFNPNNPSYHPVEAAGTNQTPKMNASLAGASPYKLWNFTMGDTVRCLHCHASGATPDVMPDPLALPPPGSALQPHTSSNRGILVKNYRDRVLTTRDAAYNNADFALCYTCHSNTPFATDGGGTDRTNFSLHGYHTAKLTGMGSTNTDIDTPGAGGGNAICAECHFRLHSTTNKVGAQVIDGTRLVNFAPDVQPYNGVISWRPGATSGGSCTLTCHGVPHGPRSY